MSKASEFSDSWSLGERSLADDPKSAVGGADVAELQGLLGGLGYQLPDDGMYGPTTADQVRQFQKDRRLGVDGVFGAVTLAELTRIRTLMARHEDARQRAQHLTALHEGNGSPPGENPSSNVWCLIDSLARS